MVNEAPAFAVNRILCPMLNEAFFVLGEGIASARDIDTGMVLGCNHPIGPLALSDLVGLDTLLHVQENLHRELGDKYRPAPMLVKLVRAGGLGAQSGEGACLSTKLDGLRAARPMPGARGPPAATMATYMQSRGGRPRGRFIDLEFHIHSC